MPAPKHYTTHNYALTFSTPAGSTYCPLGRGWVGSDHGTVLFLNRPDTCGGAGYPSAARGFSPASIPRIEVFYAYSMGEDAPKPPPCDADGWANLLGRRRAICRGERDGMLTEEVSARYMASSESQVTLTLVTTPATRERDLSALRALTASLRSCAANFADTAGKVHTFGTGRSCPAGGWF